MELIEWFDDTFQVRYADQTISLLPKEYALLQYLFNWKNRTFSRDELLDRVWAMEEPTDRTVDDHIYRLRRKLNKWSHLFTIETVRGVGYRLHWKIKHLPKPATFNQDFSKNVRSMLETYHGMGMGAAMHTLASHQDVLGFQLDPFYEVYLPFVRGDFSWFVRHPFPLPEKLFYLFHVYYMVQADARASLQILDKIQPYLAKMPDSFRLELQIASIGLFAQNGEYERARIQLEATYPLLETIQSKSFILFFQSQQCSLDLLTGRLDSVEAIVEQAMERLQEVPMQRELGTFTLLRGFCLYLRNRQSEARQVVDEGIEVILATRFVPHLIYAVRNVLFFYQNRIHDPEWQRKYEVKWRELAQEYQFEALRKEITELFSNSV